MLIQSTNTIRNTGGLKFLVFGPPGAGKTRLCATMPNPIILSAEGGLLSLRDQNLPFIEIKNVTDFVNAWKWVITSAEARKFNSICIDSVSEIAENELRFQKSQKGDGRQQYGKMQDEVTETVKNFRRLQGPHIYFSAKQATFRNEGMAATHGLLMPGQNLAQIIPFDFDEVFQLVPGKTPEGVSYSALRTQSNGEGDIVKDRSGSLEAWEPPHLGNIINKILTKG